MEGADTLCYLTWREMFLGPAVLAAFFQSAPLKEKDFFLPINPEMVARQ